MMERPALNQEKRMYERILDKQEKPTIAQMTAHCRERNWGAGIPDGVSWGR